MDFVQKNVWRKPVEMSTTTHKRDNSLVITLVYLKISSLIRNKYLNYTALYQYKIKA